MVFLGSRLEIGLNLKNFSLAVLHRKFCWIFFFSALVFISHFNPKFKNLDFSFSSVQSLSHVRLFATPWTAAHQASLSITNSWSLLKLMSIESVMPSSHLILCHPLLLLPSIFPNIRVFSNESVLCIIGRTEGQSIGASASASVLPVNIQDCGV